MRYSAFRHRFILSILLVLSASQLASNVGSQPYLPTSTSHYGIAPSMPLPTIGRSPAIEPAVGIVRVLVIAVAFADVNYTLNITRLTKNYLGMLSTYYSEISYGKLMVEGEVHGWYKLRFPKAHYGRDCKGITIPIVVA